MRIFAANIRKPPKGLLVFGAALLIYVTLYFALTKVFDQGDGSSSGPIKVRIFASEYQLAIFYPVYLVERTLRNGDTTTASFSFNCDFEDQIYANRWMYGDGKYNFIWYNDVRVLLLFLAGLAGLTLAAWKLGRFPFWLSSILGYVGVMLMVFIYFLNLSTRQWEFERLLAQRNFLSSVLWLTTTDTNGVVRRSYMTTVRRHGNGGRLFLFADHVSAGLQKVSSNDFTVLFFKRGNHEANETNYMKFPYGTVTKTNWCHYEIEGVFPWYKPGAWNPHERKWVIEKMKEL